MKIDFLIYSKCNDQPKQGYDLVPVEPLTVLGGTLDQNVIIKKVPC